MPLDVTSSNPEDGTVRAGQRSYLGRPKRVCLSFLCASRSIGRTIVSGDSALLHDKVSRPPGRDPCCTANAGVPARWFHVAKAPSHLLKFVTRLISWRVKTAVAPLRWPKLPASGPDSPARRVSRSWK